MLDYAANGLRYWPVEAMQGFLAQGGVGADERLADAFGSDVDFVEYWQKLRDNLADGRIRLLFIADRIPSELLAVVEFLNTHMDHTEVLAVEIPQFVGEGLRTLAPRVLGQTQAARQNRQSRSRASRTWDEEGYFEDVDRELPSSEADFVRRYFAWVREQGWRIVFGRGAINGSFSGRFQVAGEDCLYPVVCYTKYIEFEFAWLSPPFDDDGKRRELVRRLNQIPGANFSEDTTTPGNKYPTRPLSLMAQDGALEVLTDAILWYKQEIERFVGNAAKPAGA